MDGADRYHPASGEPDRVCSARMPDRFLSPLRYGLLGPACSPPLFGERRMFASIQASEPIAAVTVC